jgi:hypothetical protein
MKKFFTASQIARPPRRIQGKWFPGETFDTNFTNCHQLFWAGTRRWRVRF